MDPTSHHIGTAGDGTAGDGTAGDGKADGDHEAPLWHVTLTVAGARVETERLRRALDRLVQERPFLGSARYAADRVELRYWDEAEDVDGVAALALQMWAEHRRSAALPDWHVVGLEVVDRGTVHQRAAAGRWATPEQAVPRPLQVLGDVRPL